MQNNINKNNNSYKTEETQIPKALRNDSKDNWRKIINEEKENKNF